jgi:hypothetical protein
LRDDALARWVDALLRRWPPPWRYTCLKRAAVLYHLLRRAGRPVELRIGVRRAGGTGGALAAHAWLVRDGVPYLEPQSGQPSLHAVIVRLPEGSGVKSLADDPAQLLLETLRLQSERSRDELRTAWANARTDGLARLVAFEGCALWLAHRLARIDARLLLPFDFANWLQRRVRKEVARNLLVGAQVDALAGVFAADGIPYVLLKGAARQALGDALAYAAVRSMRDVDVLVPAARAPEAWHQLRRRGYERAAPPGATPTLHHHFPPLWDRARITVELHTSTSRRLPPLAAWRRAICAARTVEREGRTLPVPSDTELLWHAITHGLDQQARAFRLQPLLDVALLCASGAEIDWGVIVARFAGDEIEHHPRAIAWLRAASWLVGRPLPPELSTGLPPFELGRALRWRLAVFRHTDAGSRSGERLLEEGMRCEIGLGLSPAVRGAGIGQRTRGHVAASAAQGMYRAWRVAERLARPEAPLVRQPHDTDALRLAVAHPEPGRTLHNEHGPLGETMLEHQHVQRVDTAAQA